MVLLINDVFIIYKAMNIEQEKKITKKGIRNKKWLRQMKRSNSINIQNSINVNIYQKYNEIYSGFNDNNKFTYEFVKDKSTTSITKTPTPTKYDSYQRGSKRVTNITKEQIEGNINKQKEKSNSKLSYIDKLYKNESYPRKHINNSVDYQSKSRNNNLNRIKNKTEKTFNKYSTASCSGSLHESFSYKPSLNKTSLKIASNLESSMQRLTKKRKIYSSNHHKNAYSFDINSNHTIKKYPSKSNKKIEEMYRKGLDRINIKKQIFNENIKKKENEYQQFTFIPTTNKDSAIFYNMKAKHKSDFTYNNQSTWYSKVHKSNDIRKIKYDEEVIQQCTFTPRIKQLDINNDHKIIKSKSPVINDYVNQRRIVIENTKKTNKENEKIFGNNQDFQIKITVPKEFHFTQRKPYLYIHSLTSPIEIDENRKELGTYSFFNENKAIYVDHKQSFLNS